MGLCGPARTYTFMGEHGSLGEYTATLTVHSCVHSSQGLRVLEDKRFSHLLSSKTNCAYSSQSRRTKGWTQWKSPGTITMLLQSEQCPPS